MRRGLAGSGRRRRRTAKGDATGARDWGELADSDKKLADSREQGAKGRGRSAKNGSLDTREAPVSLRRSLSLLAGRFITNRVAAVHPWTNIRQFRTFERYPSCELRVRASGRWRFHTASLLLVPPPSIPNLHPPPAGIIVPIGLFCTGPTRLCNASRARFERRSMASGMRGTG